MPIVPDQCPCFPTISSLLVQAFAQKQKLFEPQNLIDKTHRPGKEKEKVDHVSICEGFLRLKSLRGQVDQS
jgi:hypothetical protein